jgi:hypothetical protein
VKVSVRTVTALPQLGKAQKIEQLAPASSTPDRRPQCTLPQESFARASGSDEQPRPNPLMSIKKDPIN